MRNPSALFFLLLCTALTPAGCSRGPGPLSPEEALQSFQIHEGFRVELFAAEPNVIDPVELVFDEQGRAFVAEMLDYPFDPPAGEKPKSRIRLLVDSDDDGRIDSASVFADGLRQVTSLLPWKGGLIATAAPDILYLQDTDGDGEADRREVLFTGFSMGDDPQGRITNLRFGVDNWIYASNSGRQGTITSPAFPDAPAVSVLGTDFRFRLDRKRFEPASGGAQFGLAMDDWGHRFLTQNTVHVRHVVIPRRYLERNPFLASGRAVKDISDHGRPSAPIFQLTPPQHWREVRTRMRQRRFDDLSVDRKEIASGYFTAASGGTIYSGDTFGEEFRGNLFTGEVSGNLVHRDLLRADGVTFTAQRAAEERDREFLASTDPWFRPCNFTTGPDGNLYMVDIYREFVETPASIPEELLEDMDMYSGNRRGRIYRIVPSSSSSPGPAAKPVKPNLGRAGIAELVRLLSHPNGWWRLTAQRLLLERQDAAAVPALQKVLKQSDSPQARLHALYALEGLNVLQASMVRAALDDAHPGVREHALRLSDRFPVLAAQLARRVKEPSARVAFQLALSLGNYKDPDSFQALVALAARNSHDPWFRTAILSSEAGSSVRMLEALLARPAFFQNTETGKEKFLEELSAVIGARNNREEVGRLLRILAASPSLRSEDWQVAGLSGLARGLKPAGAIRLRIGGAETFLGGFLRRRSQRIQEAAMAVARHLELRSLLSQFASQTLDAGLPIAKRRLAVRALAGGRFEQVRPVFEKLLDSPLDPQLSRAAIRTLAWFDTPEVGNLLISRWKRFGPEERNHVLDVLLSHGRLTSQLFEALADGQMETAAFDVPRREKLFTTLAPAQRNRARKLFAVEEEESDRRRVWEDYRSALDLEGDGRRGQKIFEEKCGSCHLPRKGKRVGPDLARVKGATRARLLEAILNPSRDIDPNYTNYIITTRDGRIYDGVIASQRPGTLTLRHGEEEDETLLRANIERIRASSVSLMPDGFEREMSRQDLADVIAFLEGSGLHQH